MQDYVGQCACGAVTLRLRSELAPSRFQPRSDARTCGFCREHDGVWISDPGGTLELGAAGVTTVRTFASGQVQFHFCSRCGQLAYALFEDASEARSVAVVRLALFDAIRAAAPPVVSTSFDGEAPALGRLRRLEKWTPVQPGTVSAETRPPPSSC